MSGETYSRYGDWKGWSGRRFGQQDRVAEVYFAAETKRAGLGQLRGLSVLEIGSGNGEFARWAVDQGASYIGTEMVPELVSAGRRGGFRMLYGECNLLDEIDAESIDVAVAFDVVEHLSLGELQSLVGEVRACLKPGGLILCRVPSGDSPFARGVQHGDITHKLTLGSSAVRQVALFCGFEVLQIREPVLPLFGLGLKSGLKRGLVQMARSLLFPVFRTAFIGDARAVLTPNLVFVLRKPT